MRKSLCSAIAGFSLALATGSAYAAFIDIFEGALETDPVIVATNLVLTAPMVITPESALITGFHHPGISPAPIAPGLRAAALFEPGNPQLVSDYVLLTVSDVRLDPVFGQAQDLVIQFVSVDILLPDLLAQISPMGFMFTGGVVETGMPQDLSALLGTLPEGLIIRVLSDAQDAPEPASLALLGLGLAGLGFARRRRLAA